MLLPLIKNVAQCYHKRNDSFIFLLHLLRLHSPDSPDLFIQEIQSPVVSDSDSSTDDLKTFVKTFVVRNNLFDNGAESDFELLLVSIILFIQNFTFLLYYRTALLPLRAHFNAVLLALLLRYLCILIVFTLLCLQVISDKEWLPKSTLVTVALNWLQVTNKNYSLTAESARTHICVGILYFVAAGIILDSGNFQWLKYHAVEVIKLSEAYCAISRFECFQNASHVTAPQLSKEVTEFFNFFCVMKNIFEKWRSVLLTKQLSPSDLKSMVELKQTVRLLSSVIPNHCVLDEDTIARMNREYNLFCRDLEQLLVRKVPGHSESTE